MLPDKNSYPQESELILCTVTKVLPHSVFCRIEEYGKTGMIHISEVSPGRIRNIRDFVKEGKVIVCKVLRVNLERGHIDLSLRRVNESQRRNKLSQIKQEQLAEKIVETAARALNLDPKKVYEELSEKLLKDYEGLYPAFQDVAEDLADLEKLGVKKQVAAALKDVIIQRIKPAEVVVEGDLKLRSYEPDGVKAVINSLKKAKAEGAEVTYLAAGNYRLRVKAADFKEAEGILSRAAESALEIFKEKNGEGSFERVEA